MEPYMTAEFSYNRLGALPMTPFAGAPLCTSPRVNPPPAGYVWFFDLLTKELHHTKLSDWQISLVVIGLERMIPPDEFVNIEAEAKSAVIAKLEELRNNYPESDAIQAITTGLLDLISRTHIDPKPTSTPQDAEWSDSQFRAQTAELDEAVPTAEADHVAADSEAKEADEAQAAAEASQDYSQTVDERLAEIETEASQQTVDPTEGGPNYAVPGPKRKKKKHG